MSEPGRCICCGSEAGMVLTPVMWQGLGDEWGISTEEYLYIDRQQGEACARCRANLRTQALALGILRVSGHLGPFTRFARSIRGRLLRILEINEAGSLTGFFPRRSRHELRTYPEVDMMEMTSIPDASYDLVIHSDTLEHVPDPVRGLRECLRILKPGAACVFTVPIVVGRVGRRRDGLPVSHHGSEASRREDMVVVTEYGADAWRQVLDAGFAECRIVAVAPPCAHALIGIKA